MRQEERREATRKQVLAAAMHQFGEVGFEATTMDAVARGADVAKGAVYHYFKSKRDLFEAVFDTVSAQVAETVAAHNPVGEGAVEALVSSTRVYFQLCADPAVSQITLRDGPTVLGFERWKELDAKHFGGLVSAGLALAIEVGAIKRQPVEPIARMFLASIQAAALDCAAQDDFETASLQYLKSMEMILRGLASLK